MGIKRGTTAVSKDEVVDGGVQNQQESYNTNCGWFVSKHTINRSILDAWGLSLCGWGQLGTISCFWPMITRKEITEENTKFTYVRTVSYLCGVSTGSSFPNKHCSRLDLTFFAFPPFLISAWLRSFLSDGLLFSSCYSIFTTKLLQCSWAVGHGLDDMGHPGF